MTWFNALRNWLGVQHHPKSTGDPFLVDDEYGVWTEGPCFCCHPDANRLTVQHFSAHHHVCAIERSEMNLDRGRFVHFSRQWRNHVVSVELPAMSLAGEIIDWIGENVRSPWSIRFNFDSRVLLFSFASDNEAAMFKLRWA